ncbi:uncharacterized protein LOC107371953 [Tetranychus urticae]|uniref:uncharacterized protein LOC107371953 n=1 Tax=Tetranychus urticae TaxID=32264 RepID=UPI00077BCED9|nr:uncharacterized protein LOC107371953 [Tetranychus urticae]
MDLRKHPKPCPVLTPENIEAVRKYFEQNPRASIRKSAPLLNMSRETLRYCLRKILRLFPYKISTAQRLTEASKLARETFCGQILGEIHGETAPFNRIIFTDEAHFYLDGFVNRQNYRFWGSERPVFQLEKNLHPAKVTFWAAFTIHGVFLHHFTETVNSERYCKMLTEKWIPVAREKGVIDGWYFMQDGAPPHRTRDAFNILHQHYGNRVIAYGFPDKMGCGIDWPPYSPDLTPCDYYLWGYLKDAAYRAAPKTLDELIASVYSSLSTITHEILNKVVENFVKRLEYCYMQNGGHFEKIYH